MERLAYRFKDAKYFTHTYSSNEYSSDEILYRVNWSGINETQSAPKVASR